MTQPINNSSHFPHIEIADFKASLDPLQRLRNDVCEDLEDFKEDVDLTIDAKIDNLKKWIFGTMKDLSSLTKRLQIENQDLDKKVQTLETHVFRLEGTISKLNSVIKTLNEKDNDLEKL